MREQIINDLKEAMKSQNKELLSVIRMVKGAISLEEINKKRELTDEEVIDVIGKQIKTRKESIVEFEKGARQDLIDQTNKEIEILNKYMPEQLSLDEVSKIVTNIVNEINPTSMRDMGKVMGEATKLLKGKADMSAVSKLVKEKIEANL